MSLCGSVWRLGSSTRQWLTRRRILVCHEELLLQVQEEQGRGVPLDLRLLTVAQISSVRRTPLFTRTDSESSQKSMGFGMKMNCTILRSQRRPNSIRSVNLQTSMATGPSSLSLGESHDCRTPPIQYAMTLTTWPTKKSQKWPRCTPSARRTRGSLIEEHRLSRQ